MSYFLFNVVFDVFSRFLKRGVQEKMSMFPIKNSDDIILFLATVWMVSRKSSQFKEF